MDRIPRVDIINPVCNDQFFAKFLYKNCNGATLHTRPLCFVSCGCSLLFLCLLFACGSFRHFRFTFPVCVASRIFLYRPSIIIRTSGTTPCTFMVQCDPPLQAFNTRISSHTSTLGSYHLFHFLKAKEASSPQKQPLCVST